MSHPWTTVSSVIFAFTGIFLMFIILLQRGRGGGLAGAFGAMGGQSAFGTKAGDVFTRITIGVAVFWIIMAALTTFAMRYEQSGRFTSQAAAAASDQPNVDAAGPGTGESNANKKDIDPFEDGAGKNATPPAEKSPPATNPAAAPKTPAGSAAGGGAGAKPAPGGPELKFDETKKPAATK